MWNWFIYVFKDLQKQCIYNALHPYTFSAKDTGVPWDFDLAIGVPLDTKSLKSTDCANECVWVRMTVLSVLLISTVTVLIGRTESRGHNKVMMTVKGDWVNRLWIANLLLPLTIMFIFPPFSLCCSLFASSCLCWCCSLLNMLLCNLYCLSSSPPVSLS